MSNAIILNGKRHVPTHAEGLYGHRCDLCSLKDEHLCDDNLEREYYMLDCCPLCQCLGGTHFIMDNEGTTMNNQAEVSVAMQGVDDVMNEMWESIKYNDEKIDSERVEATYVVDVVQAHGKLMEAMKNLRAAYTFYAEPAPTAENEMREADLGIDFAPSLEAMNRSND